MKTIQVFNSVLLFYIITLVFFTTDTYSQMINVSNEKEYKDFVTWAFTNELNNLQQNLSTVDINTGYKDQLFDWPQSIGWNALMAAAYVGNTEIVKWLLDNGADPNAQSNPDLYTAVMLAAMKGEEKTAEYLAKVTDLELKNKKGKTAEDLAIGAVASYKIVSIQAKKEQEESNKELLEAIKQDNYDKFTDIAGKLSFELEIANKALLTAAATSENHSQEIISKLLLKSFKGTKPDINAKNDQGQTALMLAAQSKGSKSLEVLEYLLEKGIDINANDNAGKTALDYAQEAQDQGKINALVAKGAKSTIPPTKAPDLSGLTDQLVNLTKTLNKLNQALLNVK